MWGVSWRASNIVIQKKAKIRVPLLKKKVAPKRYPMTITITKGLSNDCQIPCRKDEKMLFYRFLGRNSSQFLLVQ